MGLTFIKEYLYHIIKVWQELSECDILLFIYSCTLFDPILSELW